MYFGMQPAALEPFGPDGSPGSTIIITDSDTTTCVYKPCSRGYHFAIAIKSNGTMATSSHIDSASGSNLVRALHLLVTPALVSTVPDSESTVLKSESTSSDQARRVWRVWRVLTCSASGTSVRCPRARVHCPGFDLRRGSRPV